MTTVELPTLEELLQRFADALTDERDGFWRAAEIAQMALATQRTPRERGVVARTLAQVGHCTANYTRQLALLAESFGTEYRRPDVAMSLYRAVARAAQRLGEHAGELLERALARGWHVADVAALGRPEEPLRTRLRAQCGDCHARVTIVTTLARGLRIPCPVCLAIQAQEADRVAQDAANLVPVLGVLEAA